MHSNSPGPLHFEQGQDNFLNHEFKSEEGSWSELGSEWSDNLHSHSVAIGTCKENAIYWKSVSLHHIAVFVLLGVLSSSHSVVCFLGGRTMQTFRCLPLKATAVSHKDVAVASRLGGLQTHRHHVIPPLFTQCSTGV